MNHLEKDRREAKLIDYAGMCWLEGNFWETDPCWVGIFRRLKARYWARKNNVRIKKPEIYNARRKRWTN